jgi:hypothetical protein
VRRGSCGGGAGLGCQGCCAARPAGAGLGGWAAAGRGTRPAAAGPAAALPPAASSAPARHLAEQRGPQVRAAARAHTPGLLGCLPAPRQPPAAMRRARAWQQQQLSSERLRAVPHAHFAPRARLPLLPPSGPSAGCCCRAAPLHTPGPPVLARCAAAGPQEAAAAAAEQRQPSADALQVRGGRLRGTAWALAENVSGSQLRQPARRGGQGASCSWGRVTPPVAVYAGGGARPGGQRMAPLLQAGLAGAVHAQLGVWVCGWWGEGCTTGLVH